jgi:hypothetical protein
MRKIGYKVNKMRCYDKDGRVSDVFLVLFIAMFLISAFMILKPHLTRDASITGFAASGTTLSNVTVSKNFAITLSTNLSNGIFFGNTSTADHINGSGNYDSNDALNLTTYNVSVDAGASINVDFCISANGNLIDSATNDAIGLGNETYSNSSTGNSTVPRIVQRVAMTTTDTKAGADFAAGGTNFLRFWINVTAQVPSGSYNNSITITGKEVGTAC